MNIIKKKAACMAIVFMMLMVPVCAAYAAEDGAAAAGYPEDGSEQMLLASNDLKYLSWLTASIVHDVEDTGFIYCSGMAGNYDKDNYRMKITLNLLWSYSSSPSVGLWTKMATWSERFYETGTQETHFYYRGTYKLGRYYCTENCTELYKGPTTAVLETAKIKSGSIYITSGKWGV